MNFIVGAHQTKASYDLASHFHWNSIAMKGGQIIETITTEPTPSGTHTPQIGKRRDAFSNRIVGHATPPDMSSSLAVSALNTAVVLGQSRGDSVDGYLVHSDRSSQFRSN